MSGIDMGRQIKIHDPVYVQIRVRKSSIFSDVLVTVTAHFLQRVRERRRQTVTSAAGRGLL